MEFKKQQDVKRIEMGMEAKRKDLSEYRGDDRIVESSQMREIMNSKKEEIRPLFSGFRKLDYAIRGFIAGT